MAKLLEEHPEKITIVALGPLTNVAILLLSRPDLAEKIDKIIFMGASYQDGNPSPAGYLQRAGGPGGVPHLHQPRRRLLRPARWTPCAGACVTQADADPGCAA